MKKRYIVLGLLVLLFTGGIGMTVLAADTAATTGPLVGDFGEGHVGPFRRLISGQMGRLPSKAPIG